MTSPSTDLPASSSSPRLAAADVPADVMAAALKVHADALGTIGCCDGVPEAIGYAFTAGRESVWAEAKTEYWVCRTYPNASGKHYIDEFTALEDARDAAEHYAAGDPTRSNHWVERIEMVQREVPL